MKTVMLGLIAETSIHCGAGRSTGIIDLPVAREAATDYPFIPGSGFKGSLLDRARELGWDAEQCDEVFGKPDNAGRLMVSDVRLLLLPVRSMTGAYRWVTCPLVLERYRRDLGRCGITPPSLTTQNLAQGATAGVLTAGKREEKLLLEEREFSIQGPCPDGICEVVAPLIRHEETRLRLPRQLAIVSDDDFGWFCRYALPIQARNQLKKDTKESNNLWYEESLPPDSVLYALAVARRPEAEGVPAQLFPASDSYLQLGGNETVGQGWMAVMIRTNGEAA
jgi:CRISPR-associated protein Cmr4